MLLAIDVGNTNVVFAVFDENKLIGSWRSWTNTRRSADEYGIWICQELAHNGVEPTQVNGAIVSCVVPDMQGNMERLCQRYFNVTPLIVGDPDVNLGIKALVERPEDVGADRLVNSVAATTIAPGPLVVVDFGTATTFDVVDEGGNFVGGVIAPGVNISIEALSNAAAKLPQVAIDMPKKVVGKSTVPSMESGFFWGFVSMVEGIVLRIEEETDAEMTVIATGGLAEMFGDATEIIGHVDPNLTIRGLQKIYALNPAKLKAVQ